MIKLTLNILLIAFTGRLTAQAENFYSVYFSKNQVKGFKSAKLPESWFGKYQLKDDGENGLRLAGGENLCIDEGGVFIEKNKVLSISREEIRENSKYSLSNGYLHGIIPNDSVKVALDGEYYYFLFPGKSYLWESTTAIYEVNTNQYLFFSKQGKDLFIPSLISLNSGVISISELAYPSEDYDFTKTKSQVILEGQYKTYVLAPNKSEWAEIVRCFKPYDAYVRM